jgi:hypothetical protein
MPPGAGATTNGRVCRANGIVAGLFRQKIGVPKDFASVKVEATRSEPRAGRHTRSVIASVDQPLTACV